MSEPTTVFKVHRMPWLRDTIGVHIVRTETSEDNTAKKYIAKPLVFRELGVNDMRVEQPHTFTVEIECAQQLMDELWRVGIRPTNGAGSTGQLAATEHHLNDMRALVFKTKP